jgi:hypothetical protein
MRMSLLRSRKLVRIIAGLGAVAAVAAAVAFVRDGDTDPLLVEVAGVGTAETRPAQTLPPPATVPEDPKTGRTSSTTAPAAPAASPGSSTPPPPGGFPNPASTGVPAGWTPAQTMSTDLTISDPGTVLEDVRFTDGASILVTGDNVTIRRVEMLGGTINNVSGDACGNNMLVENVSFKQKPGQFEPSDYPVIGDGSYTARAIEVDGRGEGPRLGDCGPVTIENSFIKIKGADEGTAACEDVHSDGVQGYGGKGATARNNTIIFETGCGTSPWYVGSPSVNSGTYTIDRLLVSGGGYTFRQTMPGSVTGLRIVDGAWGYGPMTEMGCSSFSAWEAKLVTVDANYQVTREVRDLPCQNG